MIELEKLQNYAGHCVLLIIGFAFCLHIALQLKFRKGKSHELLLPPGPRGWPLIGNVLQMNKDQEWLQYFAWSRKYGELVLVSAMGKRILFINSIKAVHEILDRQADASSDRPEMLMMQLTGWGFNFGISNGEHWHTCSRLFHKHFHAKNVMKFHPALIRSTNLLLKELMTDPNGFAQSIRNSAAAFIMSILYGYDIAPSSSNEYVSLAEAAQKVLIEATDPGAFYVDLFPILMYIPEWMMPKWAFKKKATSWKPIVVDFKEKPYNMVRKHMWEGKVRSCVAANMIRDEIEATASTEERTKVEKIVKSCIATAHSAGTDTTVSAIMLFFLVMALHPEIQRKAQDELDAVLDNNVMPQLPDRPQLSYIEAILREVTRWQPVTPQGLVHCASQDIIYERFFIPKGTWLIGNIWTILHSEELYPDRPFEFIPERFLDKQGKLDDSVFNPAKVAFGYGRRRCPGRHVADEAIWLSIASVLRVYSITGATDQAERPIYRQSARFQNGLTSFPETFMCNAQPRSEAHKAMVDCLELGDGYILD